MPRAEGMYRLTASTGLPYLLRVTVSYPSNSFNSPRPLVIALHGGGTRSLFQGESLISNLVAPALHDIRPIILAPDIPSTADWWGRGDAEDLILELINIARNVWPVDTDRIIITGYSAGGYGTWYLGEKHSDLFSAAIPVASFALYDEFDGEFDIPLYVIHGTNDEVFDINILKVDLENIRKKGGNVTFVEVDGLSHTAVSSYVPAMLGAVDWLEDEIWK